MCCYNANSSAYYYVKKKISIDFQICISVPLRPGSGRAGLRARLGGDPLIQEAKFILQIKLSKNAMYYQINPTKNLKIVI